MSSTTVKDRLRKKLEQKKKIDKWTPYEAPARLNASYQVPMITWSIEQICPKDYPISEIKYDNGNRIFAITKMVEEYITSIKDEIKEKQSKQIYQVNLALKDSWIKSHIDCLPYMISGENGKVHPKFKNAKIVLFGESQFVLLPGDISKEQMYIEFLAICFVSQYGLDSSVDMIIHMQSWKYFMSIGVGLEFFQILTNQPEFKPYSEHLTKYHVLVYSEEFGCIRYPSSETIWRVRDHIKNYGYWIGYLKDI